MDIIYCTEFNLRPAEVAIVQKICRSNGFHLDESNGGYSIGADGDEFQETNLLELLQQISAATVGIEIVVAFHDYSAYIRRYALNKNGNVVLQYPKWVNF